MSPEPSYAEVFPLIRGGGVFLAIIGVASWPARNALRSAMNLGRIGSLHEDAISCVCGRRRSCADWV
jgi:hypothetical protein